MNKQKLTFNPKITLFHCVNAWNEEAAFPDTFRENRFDIRTVKMPCSSLVKDVYLLRAFESGADAVAVLVCPPQECRYTEGSLRAEKRVDRVKKILDEIALDGRRLTFHTASSQTAADLPRILAGVIEDLAALGPNPAV